MATALQPLLILDADDVERALGPRACRLALREAYENLHAARADRPQSVGFKAAKGKFHVKAGLLPGSQRYFAAKVNANFPDNPMTNGLPSIQGLVALFDGADGRPLALLHSGALTGLRTAGSAALAAEFGARPGASRLAIVGAGAQARYQLAAMADAFSLRALAVFDVDRTRADALVRLAGEKFGLEARVASSVKDVVSGCDIAVTLTPSRAPIVFADMLPNGAFLAAQGADNPDKQEIDPGAFRIARILCDDIEQCAKDGDLAHAIRAGAASASGVAADLAMLCAGAARGRTGDGEIVLYDSTGSGVQDVAAAAAAYEGASGLE